MSIYSDNERVIARASNDRGTPPDDDRVECLRCGNYFVPEDNDEKYCRSCLKHARDTDEGSD